MKKIILLLTLLFIPFIVKADDIEVKSIELVEKSDGVEVNSEPTFNGTNLNLDLAFTSVDDYVKYKITIKNNTDEDLEVDETPQYGYNNYIKYVITFDEEGNILKAHDEKSLTLVASYDKEIPIEEFDNGEYNEKGSVEIFVNDNNNTVVNPKTLSGVSIAIVAILLASIILMLVFNAKRKALLVITAIAIISIPLIATAARKINFNISSKIYIKDRCYTLDTTIGSFSTTEDVKEVCVFFDNNKYSFKMEGTSASWYVPSAGNNIMVLHVHKTHLTENSYVRVYDTDNNLLKEVTLENYPKGLLQVESDMDTRDFMYTTPIGTDITSDNIRVELSEDLQQYEPSEVYLIMYTSSTRVMTYKAPWVSDEEVIEQIHNLKLANTDTLIFKGFERDRRDSHLYHAVWGPIEIIT